MVVAFVLAFETKGLLLGEGADPEMLADIRQRVESDPATEHAAEILTMYMGPHDLQVNLGGSLKNPIGAEQMHKAIHRIEKNI